MLARKVLIAIFFSMFLTSISNTYRNLKKRVSEEFVQLLFQRKDRLLSIKP